MAVYTNPKYYSGPKLQRKRRLAKDGQMWQPGQFARVTDSGVVKCLDNATSVTCQFAESQLVATSSSKVLVDDIPAGGTKFVAFVTNAGSDTKALVSYIGSNEGLAVTDSICTVSTGNDSSEIFHIEDVMSNVTENRYNDTSDIPGRVIFSIVESARTAEGLDL